ncbi:PQQ-dependent sugar dehydrogenase [Roseobacter sp. N2S]|uniref:PQQ-dependent sugar dehydrogenase n=1 Tax=Roseobacter sp. N2S TaxID=2663844 RepID=UPI00285A18C7|nr:PQQ-dependent sugar dehydrogenase [Roseobacter sp. N2S]MDR6263910.1 glucose/arabinose dehydrogenase [Roseobacter sp. N2S]
MQKLLIAVMICFFGMSATAQTINSSLGALKVTNLAKGLDEPWAVAILPDGRYLVTERKGRLWLFDGQGGRQRISGVPKVFDSGQGGLLDVVAARDFVQTSEVFLTFAKPQSAGAGTALVVAKLDQEQARLDNVRLLFEMKAGNAGGVHFGSRVVEAPDGSLFVTVGERGNRPLAQDLSMHNGSVVHVSRSGQVPDGNPFVGSNGALPEIWSYGHRNPQGAALDASGQLWVVEHGAKGGDEVNRIKRGANYGWPVISYGAHYSGQKIGEGNAKQGMEQPAFYWDPSIAPSGLMIYSGKMFPEWKGDFFVGSLKFDHIARLDRKGETLSGAEQLSSRETGRVRDVREAPDGAIWFLSVDRRGLFRISR